MSNTISNKDDVIDSRDVIERIEELEQLIEGEGCEETCEEYKQELNTLKALAEQGESESRDWPHGETLVRRSYFVDYTAQLIDDCYEMPKEINSGSWPYRHITIDVEAAADELEQDYASIDFDGVEYLIRSC